MTLPQRPPLAKAGGAADADATAADEEKEQLMRTMFAKPGDHLVVRPHVGLPGRDAEILDVAHPGGRPPYRVRWSDNGHEGLVFPGPDAYVEHVTDDATRTSKPRP
jgi:hypothetical protein